MFVVPSTSYQLFLVRESLFLSDCLLVPNIGTLFSLFVSSYLMFLKQSVEFPVCQFLSDIPGSACWVPCLSGSYLMFLEQLVEFPVCQFKPDVSGAFCWVPCFSVHTWCSWSSLLSSLFVNSYLMFLEQPVEFSVCEFIPDVPVAACWVLCLSVHTWCSWSSLLKSLFVSSYLIFLEQAVEFPVCQFIPDVPGQPVEFPVCHFIPDVPGAACWVPCSSIHIRCSWSSLLSSLFVCSYLMFLEKPVEFSVLRVEQRNLSQA